MTLDRLSDQPGPEGLKYVVQKLKPYPYFYGRKTYRDKILATRVPSVTKQCKNEFVVKATETYSRRTTECHRPDNMELVFIVLL